MKGKRFYFIHNYGINDKIFDTHTEKQIDMQEAFMYQAYQDLVLSHIYLEIYICLEM